MNEIFGYCGARNNEFAELCERMEDTEANDKALMMLVEAHEENLVF